MAGHRDAGRTWSRVAGPVAFGVLLLAVVALASHGVHSATGSRSSAAPTTPGIPPVVAQFLFVAFLSGALVTASLFVVSLIRMLRPRRKNPEEFFSEGPRLSRWSGVALLLLIAAVFAGLIVLLIWAHGALGRPQPPPGLPFGHAAGRGGPKVGAARVSLLRGGTWVAAVGTAAAIVAMILVVRRGNRYRPSGAPDDARRQEVSRAVEATIDDIRRDPDPRHAVIAAYTRMEGTLTANGWPRQASRTPFEYLEDALRQLAVPAVPAHALTELFEVARFSRHRVDESMKQRAIDALIAVWQGLAVETS